jgi:hypothetical protein
MGTAERCPIRGGSSGRRRSRKYGKGKRGDELPEELVRGESRLVKIRETKAGLQFLAFQSEDVVTNIGEAT